MARTIDLRKNPEQPLIESAPEPIRELSPVVEQPVIQHPVIHQQSMMTDRGEKLPYRTLRWVAPRTFRNERSRASYWLAVVLFGIAALALVFGRDIVLTILLSLCGILLIVFRRQPLSEVEFEVSPLRVTVGTKRYPYEQIKSFWIQYEPEYEIRELSLLLHRWYQPYVKIQLGDQDPVQVRAILLQFIPEVEHEETFLHTFMRSLGV